MCVRSSWGNCARATERAPWLSTFAAWLFLRVKLQIAVSKIERQSIGGRGFRTSARIETNQDFGNPLTAIGQKKIGMVRVRNRYIIAELIWDHLLGEEDDTRSRRTDQSLTKQNLSKVIKDAIGLYFGDFGAARILSNFKGVMQFDSKSFHRPFELTQLT
jgi:hypothetical protein